MGGSTPPARVVRGFTLTKTRSLDHELGGSYRSSIAPDLAEALARGSPITRRRPRYPPYLAAIFVPHSLPHLVLLIGG